MRLEHKSEEELRREILAVIGRHIDLKKYKIFFFGSRVSGKGSERSDIDVGIEGQNPVPDNALAKIREDMEDLPTLYSIDVIDFVRADDDFQKVAKEHMEIIHTP